MGCGTALHTTVDRCHTLPRAGAFYTKFGQYMSTLNYALPPEWTETLSELQVCDTSSGIDGTCGDGP